MKTTHLLLLCSLPLMTNAHAALVHHNTFDNATVGAGLGTDTTQAGPFSVGDLASGNTGTAENIIDGGATTSNHVSSGATGVYGEALSFDRTGTGSNRGVTFGDINDIGTGSYTVTTWFNTSTTSGIQFLAGKGNTGSTSVGWSIFIENGNLITRLGGGGSSNRASQSIAFTSTNTWTHVAMVVDNTTGIVTSYLNGSSTGWNNGGGGPTGNTFTAGSNISDASDLTLGISSGGTAEFRGELDDFRIYDEALISSAVTQTLQAIPEPSSSALLGLTGLALLLRRRK